MRNHDSPRGRPAPTLTWLAALLSLSLAGCSMAPARPASSPDLSQACLRRVLPPADLVIVEDEPVARGDTVGAALALLDPLRAWGRRCSARMQSLQDWSESEAK